MKNKERTKVVLLSHILAHYRKDVYKYISDSEKYDFYFIGGRNYQNINNIENLKGVTLGYLNFSFFKHRFYYLKGSLKYILKIKPEIVISSGVDFHLIHTIILFFIYRIILRKKFIWWSQGTKGHQGTIGWLARKFFYRFSSGVLLYGEQGKANLIRMNVQPDRLKVIGNCLNDEDYGFINYTLESKRERKEDDIKILFTGRITSKVDLFTFIKAIHLLKVQYGRYFICYIIGDGAEKGHIELIKRLELNEQFLLVGAKYGKEAHSYFLDSDLYVYPGGIGLSILHAFSFSLPVITVDDYSLHFPEIELLRINKNGDVYQSGNYESLAKKILKWEDKIRNKREQIVNSSLEVIKEKGYLPKQVAEKLIDFLETKCR